MPAARVSSQVNGSNHVNNTRRFQPENLYHPHLWVKLGLLGEKHNAVPTVNGLYMVHFQEIQ